GDQSPNGTPCTIGAECSSGHCVDGVCCASACDGPCMECNPSGQCVMPATDAVCSAVACSSLTADACGSYTDITTNLCRSLGACKDLSDCVQSPRAEGVLCRASDNATCDPYEVCDGSSTACPP